MAIITITSLSDCPGVRPYSSLTEAQLRSRINPDDALFIAESPKVIKVALESGLEPVSLLAEMRHIKGDAAEIIAMLHDSIPVYTGSRELLQQLTGYKLTRGVLCAMKRPLLPSVEEVCAQAGRVAVVDGVSDTTNIGAIFRSAAALGIDAVLLTPTACDPLNRRAVRVSMGSVFLVPWTYLDRPVTDLSQLGFTTLSMALTDKSVALGDSSLRAIDRMAIVLGTEGDGLAQQVISSTDITVRIPMTHGVDSLNVAAAAAVAFWELRRTN